MSKKKKADKKDKKKKKKLTDKQLIKLLKALKPQTQQVVRVNVGQDAAKKKGEVSSVQPPFVFPTQGFPAIINQGQAPPPTAPSWSALPMSQQPQLQPLIMPPPELPPAPPTMMLTDVEPQTDYEKVKVRRSKKREEEQRLGYSVKEAPEPRFKKKEINQTKLGLESSLRNRIVELPSSNDPYMPVEIQTTAENDQIGNVGAFALPSDQWVLTPEGDQPMIQEPVQTTAEIIEPPPEPTVAEVFNEPLPAVDLTQLTETEAEQPFQIIPNTAEKQKVKMSREAKIEKKQIIEELEAAILSGEIDKTDIPAEFFEVKKGVERIKKSTKIALLKPFWVDLKVMRGSAFL